MHSEMVMQFPIADEQAGFVGLGVGLFGIEAEVGVGDGSEPSQSTPVE